MSEETDKGVIAYKSTPKASEDTPWNGSQEHAAADVDDLRIMSAWIDPEDGDGESAYKLPHHKAAAPHQVVLRGVNAAMASLLGARGGGAIPEIYKIDVYNHLAEHLREFDREPPEFKSWGRLSKDDRLKLMSLDPEDPRVEDGDQNLFTKTIECVKAEPRGDNVVRSIIATNDPDLDREVILPGRIDLSYFRKAGSVLWNHRLDQFPIAKNVGFEREPKGSDATKLFALTEFADTDDGQTVHKLVLDGFVRGWSVRLLSLDGSSPTEKELRANPGWAGVRFIYRKSILIEYSITPQPANMQAVSKAIRDGRLKLSGNIGEALLSECDDLETTNVAANMGRHCVQRGFVAPPQRRPARTPGPGEVRIFAPAG